MYFILQEMEVAHKEFEGQWADGLFPGWPVSIILTKKIKTKLYSKKVLCNISYQNCLREEKA